MSKREIKAKNETINNEESIESTDNNVDTPVVEEIVAKTGVVTGCERLNVRSTPNKTPSNIIRVIDKGTSVVIGEEVGDFVKVNVDGENGYCMKKFIK